MYVCVCMRKRALLYGVCVSEQLYRGQFPISPSILHVFHYALPSHLAWPRALPHCMNIHCMNILCMCKLLPYVLHVLHVHVHV